MPKVSAKKGGKLVIVNLQHTPLDDAAYLRIYAKTDDVLRRVMQKLSLTIPPFILLRQLRIREDDGWFSRSVTVDGIEMDGIPASFVHSVKVEGEEKKLTTEPFWCVKSCAIPRTNLLTLFSIKVGQASQVKMRLGFRGHYNEPALDITHTLAKTQGASATTIYRLEYNPLTGRWVVGAPTTTSPVSAKTPGADVKP